MYVTFSINDFSLISESLTPPIVMLPPKFSFFFVRIPANVDLPHPLSPTIAVKLPIGHSTLIFFNIGLCASYANCTFLKLIL